MSWMIRISFDEWRALGGIGNPKLVRSLDPYGNWQYFRPKFYLLKILKESYR